MDGTFLLFCALLVLSYLMPATGLVYMVMLICCGLYHGHWVNYLRYIAKSTVVSDPVSVVCMYVCSELRDSRPIFRGLCKLPVAVGLSLVLPPTFSSFL